MTKNTAGVIVAIITALSGLGTAAVSLRTSQEKTDLKVMQAGYDTLAEKVNKLSGVVEKLHDDMYGVRHSAGGEDEGEDASSCPPYDAGVEPLDATMTLAPVVEPAPLAPPAPQGNTAPLQLERVPSFETLMQQNGF